MNSKRKMSNSETNLADEKNETDKSLSGVQEKDETAALNESNLTKKRMLLDQKYKTFFENICNQAMEDIDDSELEKNQNNILYGNISNKYDPDKSVTTIEKLSQMPNENHLEKLPPNLLNLLIETSTELFKDKDIHLNKKDCLLHLIERNRKNLIACPFDEMAYFKIKYLNTKILAQTDLQINQLKSFNSDSIMDLMPNCLSTFMLQFFFEIFQPSELKNFTRRTLDLMLKLKNSLEPESYFETNYRTTHLVENFLCNCFALYKYKFSITYKIGFLNYIMSLYCLMPRIAKDPRATRMAKLLPHYIEAMILSGLLTRGDMLTLEPELESELNKYKGDFLSDVNNIFNKHKIMTLKSMSRIVVRKQLVGFSHAEIEQLKLDRKSKEFLEFDSDFENLFDVND